MRNAILLDRWKISDYLRSTKLKVDNDYPLAADFSLTKRYYKRLASHETHALSIAWISNTLSPMWVNELDMIF